MENRPQNESRRTFFKVAAAGAALMAVGGGASLFSGCGKNSGDEAAGSLSLPPLPFPAGALSPYMSEKTLLIHHGRHHAKYLENLAKLIHGTVYSGMELTEIIRKARKDPAAAAVFNNAAQAANHSFFWNSMKPSGGGLPAGGLNDAVTKTFGNYNTFRKAFLDAAVSLFGSGWVWLVTDGKELSIVSASNAETPFTTSARPLLCLDVWEHAYYLDYQYRRADYAANWLDHLANWDFAAKNFDA